MPEHGFLPKLIGLALVTLVASKSKCTNHRSLWPCTWYKIAGRDRGRPRGASAEEMINVDVF